MTLKLNRPTPEEYAPFYADYVQRAIARENVLSALPKQIDEVCSALGSLTEPQALYRFGPAEWLIKEVVGHLNDVERVFSYRLLRIARGDQTPLPGFEQEDYVRVAGYDNVPLAELLSEFELLRRANILMISHLKDEAVSRLGTASGATISARALIYMLVGHVEHHMACIHEKYLPGV